MGAAIPGIAAAEAASGPKVQTGQGLLEGFEENGVNKFFGVPFAQPPVGDLRWRAPREAATWSGIRPAKEFSAACYQTIQYPRSLRVTSISEDCLFLNVWTSTLSKDAAQPVMVWFHGGGNLRGAGSVEHTDGSNLAKLGVTVVTVNFRLGAFGFLNDPTMGANFSILDNVAALRWVHDNIQAFGGDPSRVLIFGNSAGAYAVRALLQCPDAKDLFHRGILQSGGGEQPVGAAAWSAERSRDATKNLLEALGTTAPAAARAVPAERVGAAAHKLSGVFPREGHVHTPLNLVWMPVPDGKVIMEDSFPGWAPDVPVMFGNLENEARWGLSPTENYTPALLQTMAKELAGPKADEVLGILNAQSGSIFEKLDRLYTTVVWSDPTYASMRQFAADGRKVFYFQFNRASPAAVISNRLASHGSEVAYVFGNLPDDGTYDDVDRRISREMQFAFVEFAKTGVPRSTGGIVWPQFDPAQPKEVLITDTIALAPYRVDPLLRAINSLRKVT